jgi:hypothetical protein
MLSFLKPTTRMLAEMESSREDMFVHIIEVFLTPLAEQIGPKCLG